ncbi:hypothetical protein Hanom_Chr08g00752021 [Helianthus anomalus]
MTPSLISFSHLCLKWKILRRSSKMIWIRKLNRKGSASVDPKGITNVVVDKNQTLKVKSKFEMDLDKILIPKNKSHVYLLTYKFTIFFDHSYVFFVLLMII